MWAGAVRPLGHFHRKEPKLSEAAETGSFSGWCASGACHRFKGIRQSLRAWVRPACQPGNAENLESDPKTWSGRIRGVKRSCDAKSCGASGSLRAWGTCIEWQDCHRMHMNTSQRLNKGQPCPRRVHHMLQHLLTSIVIPSHRATWSRHDPDRLRQDDALK